jgi:hypothetical protein
MKKFLLIAIALLCTGCIHNNNQVFYNDVNDLTEINLPENTKFICINCDENKRYTYVYRPRRENEPIEEYTVRASNSSKEIKVKEH